MKLERSSGLLMHITSLPGKYGIGTLGQEAYEFVDALDEGGQKYWQILPIGPVSSVFGYSPYSPLSSFAGNYFFIDLELLQNEEWMKTNLISVLQENMSGDFVDFDAVAAIKLPLLKEAAADFFHHADKKALNDFNLFCETSGHWLDDYARFVPIAESCGSFNWSSWDEDIRMRKPDAIKKYSEKLKKEIDFHRFVQFIFYKQWTALKTYANARGIHIIGDIPIYVNFDSSDVWSNPSIFQLHPRTLNPIEISGVPPDYFSPTGQRWGNPLYKWYSNDKLNQTTFAWWKKRFEHMFANFDLTRVDHFRGLESYWSIPEEEPTAVNGKWVKGPGFEFFKQMIKELGDLPIIAEDLGIITPEVNKLRERLDVPGMKVLQFAFDFDNKNAYLPHNYTSPNCVVYTGTHDNNTTNGWFYDQDIDEGTRKYVIKYLNLDHRDEFHWQLITLALSSIAVLSIFPTQDILGYGGEFRMNTPGVCHQNWTWKLTPGRLSHDILKRLNELCVLYNRK